MPSNLSATEGISAQDQSWPWWPLLPLYPYGRRRTVFSELIPGQLWSLEQLQGVYYVAVPVRLTVAKVPGGLMLVNPLPPTRELRQEIAALEQQHGPVRSIVLPTASGLEHKLPLGPLARAFPDAEIWVCPGQWSFPLPLPLSWLGVPASRTKVLLEDGVPHPETCRWLSFGPLDLGVGRFQEVSCLHQPSGALLVTDALVGIEAEPPALFDLDPTPLLFHARERGNEPLIDSVEARRRGWARLVLFASYLRPELLDVPELGAVVRDAFRPGCRSGRAHFGIYPFRWKAGWQSSAALLMGNETPRLQIAPVLERLVLPRARAAMECWLSSVAELDGLNWLVPAHYSAPLPFNPDLVLGLLSEMRARDWASDNNDWTFLADLDTQLLKRGLVPKEPQLPS